MSSSQDEAIGEARRRLQGVLDSLPADARLPFAPRSLSAFELRRRQAAEAVASAPEGWQPFAARDEIAPLWWVARPDAAANPDAYLLGLAGRGDDWVDGRWQRRVAVSERQALSVFGSLPGHEPGDTRPQRARSRAVVRRRRQATRTSGIPCDGTVAQRRRLDGVERHLSGPVRRSAGATGTAFAMGRQRRGAVAGRRIDGDGRTAAAPGAIGGHPSSAARQQIAAREPGAVCRPDRRGRREEGRYRLPAGGHHRGGNRQAVRRRRRAGSRAPRRSSWAAKPRSTSCTWWPACTNGPAR